MTEVLIRTERVVRFDGRFCGGPDGTDCDYEAWDDQDPVCGLFSGPEGQVGLEADEKEDALVRCRECVEKHGKG
jgi:hypothetical protein